MFLDPEDTRVEEFVKYFLALLQNENSDAIHPEQMMLCVCHMSCHVSRVTCLWLHVDPLCH